MPESTVRAGSSGDDTLLVSVVTPSYQTAAFIRATIESVRRQDYPQIEHIVIDGGSTDGTREILASYPHLQWVSEKDRGQSDALNKGFRRASGEIIGWLNSDDTYEPHAVSTAVRYLQQHPEADAVYGDIGVIDEHGETVGASFGSPFDVIELLTRNMVKQPALFMRRRMLDALGGVDESLHYVMDHELWLRAGLEGLRLDYHEGRLANFRLCTGTKTYTSVPAFRREWRGVLQRALEHPYFSNVPDGVGRAALASNDAAYHLAEMRVAIDRRDRTDMLAHLARAVARQKRLLANRGLWWQVVLGLAGRRPDRLRKYRKNLTAATAN